MGIQIQDNGRYMHVEIQDERLDVFSVSKLKNDLSPLIKNQSKSIVLNLNNCTYCDASGIGAINTIYRVCEEAMVSLYIIGINKNFGKLVRICKLDSLWNIVEELGEVEASIMRCA